MTPNSGLRLAVIGCGAIARRHTEIFAAEGCQLQWVIGRLPEAAAAFAREYEFARHGVELAKALDDSAVDAVVLCTPSPQHAKQAAACLEAGKHVLVEIPLALSLREAQALAELARKAGRTLMVAHTNRFHEVMIRVRQQVLHGGLGVRSVIARWTVLRRQNIGSSGYVRSWTDNLLWHHAQHATDSVLFMLGIDEPGRVVLNAMFARPDPKLGIPFDLSLQLRTDRDQLITVAASYNSFIKTCDFMLMGDEETLVVDCSDRPVIRNQSQLLYEPEGDDSRLHQNREFLAAVREGRPATINAEAVLPVAELLQNAQDAYDVSWAAQPNGGPRS